MTTRSARDTLMRRAAIAGALALLVGAAYLAVTRADALMLDIARIAGCF
jgi:hypothetical protein